VIVINARHLHAVLAEFAQYYNRDRPHRSLDLQPPLPTLALRPRTRSLPSSPGRSPPRLCAGGLSWTPFCPPSPSANSIRKLHLPHMFHNSLDYRAVVLPFQLRLIDHSSHMAQHDSGEPIGLRCPSYDCFKELPFEFQESETGPEHSASCQCTTARVVKGRSRVHKVVSGERSDSEQQDRPDRTAESRLIRTGASGHPCGPR